jgi:hypothetical protein
MKKIIIAVGIIVGIVVIFGMVITMGFNNTEITYVPNTDENAVVQPVKFGHSNVYFIKTENGHILVDAGMPGDNTKLDEIFSLIFEGDKLSEILTEIDYARIYSSFTDVTDTNRVSKETILKLMKLRVR